MKIAIYSRGLDKDLVAELADLIVTLRKHDIDILLHEPLLKMLHNVPDGPLEFFTDTEGLDNSTDFIISLGGDGTILDTVTLVKNKNIPILGINYGRLGFLASIGKEEMNVAIDSIINSTFVIDRRTMIHLDSNMPIFQNAPFALNEFAVHKRDTSPMIKIHTYLNGEFLSTYWCDGLIVATPTGSTGYSLSCSGPIVFPDAASFVITPVAPHNLNVRPIVVPDTHIISFEIESRSEEVICVLDARREIVNKTIQLAVKKETFSASLVRLNENNFLSTLHDKLTWGLDKRN